MKKSKFPQQISMILKEFDFLKKIIYRESFSPDIKNRDCIYRIVKNPLQFYEAIFNPLLRFFWTDIKIMGNKKLIKNLKKGNQKAFKDLYLSHYSKLIQTAKRFNFKFLTPDDFVQETFLKLYHNRKQLKENVLIDKQLFVICKNIIINHLNRENKVIPLDNNFNVEAKEETTSVDYLDNQKKQFYNLLQQLPEQQQKIFTLHKLESYSYQEIAEITCLSKKTIANHIYLANKFIQKKISNA